MKGLYLHRMTVYDALVTIKKTKTFLKKFLFFFKNVVVFFENASVLLKLFSKNYSTKRELNSCQPSVKPTFQSLDGEL